MITHILSQVLTEEPDARDRAIMRAALKRAEKYPVRFSKYVRGIRCVNCESRNTKTEFYRIPPDTKPSFGVTACDDCGAC